MRRIVAITPDAPDAADSVLLDQDGRTRRRIVLTTRGGHPILLDEPRTVRLLDGQGLRLDDGSVVRVEAADEALIEIAATDVAALVRIAWHLGNRHLPTQLLGERLRIRDDHVIAAMAEGLGGTCTAIRAPFDPEGGAYAGEPAAPHHHDHGDHHTHHDHDHGHTHG